MTVSQIYWLITLPKISSCMGIGLIIIGICSLISIIFVWGDAQYDSKPLSLKDVRKYIVSGVLSLVIGSCLSTFIPTTKEIVALYGINYITNQKSLTDIPPKLFELANIKIDELLQTSK